MVNEQVFVDTWAHGALLCQQDQWHAAALEISRKLDSNNVYYVTTEWVLTEFLSTVVKPPLRMPAVEYIRRLCASPRVQVLPATSADWLRGLTFYASRADKDWSLFDCLSILVCQDRGITDVFTGDSHFEQAGLRVLLRPPS